MARSRSTARRASRAMGGVAERFAVCAQCAGGGDGRGDGTWNDERAADTAGHPFPAVATSSAHGGGRVVGDGGEGCLTVRRYRGL